MRLLTPTTYPVVYNGVRYRSGEVSVLDRDVAELLAIGWEEAGTMVPAPTAPSKKKSKTKKKARRRRASSED